MARVKYFDGPSLTIFFLGYNLQSFWSGGFTTATAMNQKDKNPGKFIFVHFDMTFLTTITQ